MLREGHASLIFTSGWMRKGNKKELNNLRNLDWIIEFLYVKLFKTKLPKYN